MHSSSDDMICMRLAHDVAAKSECKMMPQGAVCVDATGFVRSIGWAGNPQSMVSCIKGAPCQYFDECDGIHAVERMLLHIRHENDVHTVYATHMPAFHAVKMLLDTQCQVLAVGHVPHNDDPAVGLWRSSGRELYVLRVDHGKVG